MFPKGYSEGMMAAEPTHKAPNIRELLERSDEITACARKLIDKQDKSAEERRTLQENIREMSDISREIARLSIEQARRVIDK